ncbi:putative ctd kinase subunit gamma [Rosellinia necatrix]|uniref:Putative ctd kinase subunit gamma n=1 Tax=Rosellinia necatrix TaxID=77044 RepID=A0A1W2TER0_ROSNE|nr:putative ctd kinase subunit gamma [Rosellinia necatrix]
MADPFEVRMRFSSQLEHLNASTTSAQKAAQYALKYKDMDEDLHSCILEQLEKTNMNTRANIMYFIEHLLEMATKERHNDYIRMMQRDIIRVVDAVCPENGSGAANVKVVRKVLQGLQNKFILLEQTVVDLEGCLKERDTSANDFSLSSPVDGNAQPTAPASATDTDAGGPQPTQRNGVSIKPTKRQIEQRIEEDRERHKRMRESMWVVPPDPVAQARKFFGETSDLGEDDRILGEEEIADFRGRVKAIPCKHRGGGRRDERPRPRTTNGVARRI